MRANKKLINENLERIEEVISNVRLDGWTWDDGIHLAATEHKRYIGHIAARVAAKD